MLKKITANLFVDSIEEQLPFWIDTLGFGKTVEVPEQEGGPGIGFTILVRDNTELMLQTWKSIEDDIGPIERVARSSLFIEVDDIDDIEKRLARMEKIIERRSTFYGATEIGVLDPAGNFVIFAQFSATAE